MLACFDKLHFVGTENEQPGVPSVGSRGDVMASSSSDEDANETCDADEPLYVVRIRHSARKCSDSGDFCCNNFAIDMICGKLSKQILMLL